MYTDVNTYKYRDTCQHSKYVCMLVYAYVHRSTSHTCMYLYISIYVSIYTFIHMHNCVFVSTYIDIRIHVYIYRYAPSYTVLLLYTGNATMAWLRLVGSLKSWGSFAEYSLFYWALLQKKPVMLRSLLIEATRYGKSYMHSENKVGVYTFTHTCICIYAYMHIYIYSYAQF